MSDQALAGIEELTAWSVGDIVNALASADQSRAVDAVREAATRGLSFGIPNPLEVEMAELICE